MRSPFVNLAAFMAALGGICQRPALFPDVANLALTQLPYF
jgi:hypothetical protein